MSHSERDLAMRGFRSGSLRVVVATGVFARYVDGSRCPDAQPPLVINYGLPCSFEEYRSRLGYPGFITGLVVINLVTSSDEEVLRGFIRSRGISVAELPMDVDQALQGF